MFVSNKERSPQAPDVPTAREAGYPDLTFDGTVGIYGWRGMPAEIQNRISTDVQAITSDPAFRSRVATAGSAARSGTPAEFTAAIEEQRVKIAAIHKTHSASRKVTPMTTAASVTELARLSRDPRA